MASTPRKPGKPEPKPKAKPRRAAPAALAPAPPPKAEPSARPAPGPKPPRARKARAPARAGRGSDRELLDAYFAWVNAAPPMSAEEERTAAYRLQAARAQVVRVALETPLAIDHVLRLGRRVARGETTIFDVLEDFPGGDEGQAAAALAEASERLRAADRSARRALDVLELTRLSPERRTAEQRSLVSAHSEATAVLAALPLKRRHVQDLAKTLKVAAAESSRARRDLATRPGDARRRLRVLHEKWRMEPERLERLARAAAAADRRARQLRDELLAAHGPLVVKMARSYGGRGLDFEDLLQEGNMGLDTAIERYDPARGTRLSTLAVHWVRHHIGRAVANKGRNVRIPVHVGQQLHRILRVRGQVLAETGEAPGAAEIARRTNLSLSEVEELTGRTFGTVSLDETLTADGDATRIDFLADPDAPTPADDAERASDTSALLSLLETLPRREREVLERRFGLGSQEGEQTLQQIGTRLRVTRERARQIVARALERLRAAARERGIDLPMPPED